MKINSINSITLFRGFDPYPSETPIKKSTNDDNFGTNSTFRDEELFDEDIDKLDYGYRIYDYNDVKLYEPAKETKYYKFNNIDTDEILGFAVSGEPNFDNNNVKVLNDNYETLLNACKLQRHLMHPIFSLELYDQLRPLRKNGYTFAELADIAEMSKLKRGNKNEYISPEMVDAAIYCHNKFPGKAKDVLRSMIVLNMNKDEVLSNSAFKFLKSTHFKDAKSAINTLNSGIYRSNYYNYNK